MKYAKREKWKLLIAFALLTGILSGCTEKIPVSEPPPSETAGEQNADKPPTEEGTAAFLWPEGLIRVEADDLYFTPESDDYAYYVASDDGRINTGIMNLSAMLYEFDASGNISRITERIPVEDGAVDEKGNSIEFQYPSYTKEQHFLEAENIDRQYFISDKQRLFNYDIMGYKYALFSKPEIAEVSFESTCALTDFELLKYYTPESEDYYIQEWLLRSPESIETPIHAIVVEFASDGSTLQRTVLVKIPKENKEEYEAVKRNGFALLDEENWIFISKGNGFTYQGEENCLKQTKQELTRKFMNSSYGHAGDYAHSMAVDGCALAFSKPSFTQEQLDLYNQSIKTGVWENALVFENHYADKMTYTYGDDGKQTKRIQWVVAFEDGKACSAYTVYECYPNIAFTYALGLPANERVYEDRSLVYCQRTDFAYLAFAGMSKEEVYSQFKAEGESWGMPLILAEAGGIPVTEKVFTKQNNYIALPLPDLTDEQLAEKEVAQNPSFGDVEKDGIYASGIERLPGDDLYFTPVTEDWEIEYYPVDKAEVVLYCYDEAGKLVDTLRRYDAGGEIGINSGETEVFSKEAFTVNTYVNVDYVYYFHNKSYNNETGPSAKEMALEWAAQDERNTHFFSRPESQQ